MKQKLLNSIRLKATLLVAVLCALFTGTAWATTTTYQHIFNAKPSTGNSVALSSVNWNISATQLGNYNSSNYAGVQIGTKSAAGSITLTSSNAWGAQSGSYMGKTVITEVRIWMNAGTDTPTATVTIGGVAATSDGTTVQKNSSASSYTDATMVTYTPATNGNTGVVVINVSTSSKAGYICAMEIDCEEAGGSSLSTSDLAITGAPVALNFDLYNNSSAQAVTYTTSSTGAVTVSGGDGYVTTSVNSGTKTVTVTPTAVTPSAQTITISQEADATYAAGSKTFTVTVTDSSPITNIAALTAKAAGNYTVSLTDALVTYVNGTNAYLEDASGAVILYHCAGDLAVGDKITGTADVTYTVYNNLPEVTAFTLQTGYTKTTGNTVTPAEVTIATLESNYTSYISRYVKIVGATVTSAFSNKNSTIEQGGSSIVLRDQNSSATLTTTVNDIVTVTAHPSIYSSTHQIAVYEQSQIVVAKADPTITFDNGSVRVGQNLDLSTLFESNSTGAVTYSITAGSDKASLVGSTLTGTAEGSVTVKAEQAESSSYNAGEATATITVNPALVLSSIAVTTAPTKTTYNVGENFDPTGMVVTATYSDNSTEAVTGYTYSPNGALTTSDTEITISYTENNVTKTATQAITVNEVVDYATLPFAFDGGRADIENTDGLTQDGLDSDYSSSPLLKFKTAGTYVILKFNEQPGTLTFDIKGNSLSGSYEFTVMESANGTDYSTLKEYNSENSPISSTTTSESLTPAATTRYIKWIYTNKSSGNVALGNIALAAYSATPTITIDSDEFELTAGEEEGYLEVAYSNLTINSANDFSVQFCDANGDALASGSEPDWIDAEVTTQTGENGYFVYYYTSANLGVARTAYFKVKSGSTYSNLVTVTQTASVTPSLITGTKYVKVTSTADITDGQYLIVYEDGSVAFDGGRDNDNNKLDAVSNTIDVTIDNGIIVADATTNAAAFIIDATAGTIKSASGFYIGAESYNNELKTSDDETAAYTNSLSIDNDGNAEISMSFNSGTVSMRYNSASNQTRFRYYKSGQQAIQLYKFIYAPTSITLNGSGYATFASTNAVDYSSTNDYTAWKITDANSSTGEITFEQVTTTVAPGTGLLLKGTASTPINLTYAASGNDISSTNLLEGTTTATTITAGQYYGLSGNQFVPVNAGTVPAGKALLPASVVGSVKSFTFVFEGADGIKTVEHVSAEQAAEIFNLAGQRLQKAQRGVNIINGKKVIIK